MKSRANIQTEFKTNVMDIEKEKPKDPRQGTSKQGD